jgi:hypothetical protein
MYTIPPVGAALVKKSAPTLLLLQSCHFAAQMVQSAMAWVNACAGAMA